jgi:hypothetical protein
MTRVLLTLGTVLLAGGVYALMLRGWHARQLRQADVPPPPAPTGGGEVLVPAVPGLYVGTTNATDWLDRIAVHHLGDRARCELLVATDGVHLVRDGLAELLVPLADLESATVEQSLAGKVVHGGMLVLTWRLGARRVATAFLADDHAAHVALRDALSALLPVEATS